MFPKNTSKFYENILFRKDHQRACIANTGGSNEGRYQHLTEEGPPTGGIYFRNSLDFIFNITYIGINSSS